jgi:hypothetical protein
LEFVEKAHPPIGVFEGAIVVAKGAKHWRVIYAEDKLHFGVRLFVNSKSGLTSEPGVTSLSFPQPSSQKVQRMDSIPSKAIIETGFFGVFGELASFIQDQLARENVPKSREG